jgi:hypothetical protein
LNQNKFDKNKIGVQILKKLIFPIQNISFFKGVGNKVTLIVFKIAFLKIKMDLAV